MYKSTHSESASALRVKGIEVKINAAFSGNPYAPKLNLNPDISEYPAENPELAELVSRVIGCPAENIMLFNGATEAIHAIYNLFPVKWGCNLPTYSPYLEYQTGVGAFHGSVVVNPNNVTGKLVQESPGMTYSIRDESLIYLALPYRIRSFFSPADGEIYLRSLCKDSNVAGLRIGYAAMNERVVSALLKTGYLWNINCYAEAFLRVWATDEYQSNLGKSLEKFRSVAKEFFSTCGIDTDSTFGALKTSDPASEVTDMLLSRYGIYVRDCSNKYGLEDKEHYIRISARTEEENEAMITAFRNEGLI